MRRTALVPALMMVMPLAACAPEGTSDESGSETEPLVSVTVDSDASTASESEALPGEASEPGTDTMEAEVETEAPVPTPITISWNDGEIIETALGGGYPQMYALRDGTLLMGCDNFFGVFVARSNDHGTTWTDVVHASGTYVGAANPAFFQDEDGTIYLGYRSTENREDGSFRGSIEVSVSTDNGCTWAHHSTVYENVEPTGVFKGVWEPHFGILGGKLTCFYANDSTHVVTDFQNIEYKQWDETSGTWGNRTVVSDGTAHRSRDGMPVWTALRGGGYVCAIEGFNHADDNRFAIKLLYSSDGASWSEPITVMTAEKSGTVTAAPYVVELPTGQLLISCQTNECTETEEVYILSTVLSDGTPVTDLEEAHFSPHAYPFGKETGTESHMWNSLFYHDGYLYACGGSSSRGVIINRLRVDDPRI